MNKEECMGYIVENFGYSRKEAQLCIKDCNYYGCAVLSGKTKNYPFGVILRKNGNDYITVK